MLKNTLVAEKGVVAAGHQLTAETAIHILRAGGNACDAAIGAILTSMICEPVLSSLLGGGYMLIQPFQGKSLAYDFFTHTPRIKKAVEDIEFIAKTVDFGSATQQFNIGAGTIATPGLPAGIWQAHVDHGYMPFSAIAEQAVNHARKGVKVNSYQAIITKLTKPILLASEGSRSLFASRISPGEALATGDLFRSTELADAIDVYAREGPRFIYHGEIAKAAVRLCNESGGHLTSEDFANYRVQLRPPLSDTYRDYTITSTPTPCVGGSLIIFALQLLSHFQVESLDADELPSLIARAIKQTGMARLEATSRKHSAATDNAILFDTQLLARYRQILMQKHPSFSRGTTQISIIDKWGNAVSISVSNGEGCGHVMAGTGIMPNNMLGEEDINPIGVNQWGTNLRMSSMMAPTIARNKRRLVVTGSGGSNRIRSAILQVLVQLIDLNLPLNLAVSQPRVHVEGEKLYLEQGFSDRALEKLSAEFRAIESFPVSHMFFGGTHSVMLEGQSVSGYGDERRGGVSLRE